MVIVIDFLDTSLRVGSTGMWVKLPAARAIFMHKEALVAVVKVVC